MKTLRFWAYNQGWVRLTLKPGQKMTHVTGGRTDEGWSRTVETWEHTGDGVRRTYLDEGQDCDGYTSQEGVLFCRASEIGADVLVEDDGNVIPRPNWQEEGPVVCRDAFAEAANY